MSRVAKTGGAVQIMASAQTQATAIAVDDTHVYWTAGDIMRMAKTGGPLETIATGHRIGQCRAVERDVVVVQPRLEQLHHPRLYRVRQLARDDDDGRLGAHEGDFIRGGWTRGNAAHAGTAP